MSGNKEAAWEKFLNGRTSQYNFSYRQENLTNMNVPPVSPTPLPAPMMNQPKLNVKSKNKSVGGTKKAIQKIVLPVYKGRRTARRRGHSRRRSYRGTK